jgi:hypothetical protein
MRKTLLLLSAIIFFALELPAQAVRIQVCSRTTAVSPTNDGNGKDQRWKSAFILDSIRVEEFSPAKTVFARIGVDGQQEWNDGIWVSGCPSTNNSNCNNCSTCKTPKINGQNKGRLYGEMIDNVRVRSENNNLIIEATSEKEVCYETEPIDVHQAGGKSLILKIGYQGTEVDGFRTRNVVVNYVLNDGIVRNFKNEWGNFFQPSLAQIRTVFLPVSNNDLSEIVKADISPNPVYNNLQLEMNSSESMEADVTITDITGRKIHTALINITRGTQEWNYNTTGLDSGIYLLKLVSGEKQLSRRFVKK